MKRRVRTFDAASGKAHDSRRRGLLLVAAVALALYFLYSLVLGEMGLVKYYRMKSQYNALVQEIAHLKEDNARLMMEVRCLRNDPACIERLARDELGLARKGEIVYYYEDESDLVSRSR